MLWVVIEVVLGMVAWAVVHIVTRLLNRTRTPHRDRRQIEQGGRTGRGSRASLPVVTRRRRLTAGERSEREKDKEGKEKEKDKGKEKEKGKEREVATMTTTTRSTAAPVKETRRRGHRHTQAVHQVTDEDMRHHHDYEEEEDEDAEGEPRDRRVREMPIVVPPSQRGIQSISQEAKQTGKLRYGIGTLKGRRRTMEDQHCALVGSLLSSRTANRTSTAPITSTESSTTTTTTTSTTTSTPSFSFFGVYDGHAGNEVSDYLSRHLHARVAEELQRVIEEIGGGEPWVSTLSPTQRLGRRENVFVEAFRKIDAELRAERLNSGSTVVCVLVEETERDRRVSDEGEARGEKEKEEEGIQKEEKERGGEVCIHCANLGDSRCVISFFNDPEKVIPLSEEHKPTKPEEMKRIHAAGHIVMRARINSTIAVSRALGDFEWKGNKDCDDRSQAVSNYPDSKEIIVPSDEAGFLLILACDGLWDVLTNEQAVKFVYDKIDAQKKAETTEGGYVNLHQIAQELVAHAVVNMGSADNVSVILVTYNLQ